MPKEQDEIEDMEMESSTIPEDVVSEEVEQSTSEAEPAESSTATDETEPDSLSVVRDVVAEREEEEEAAASSAEGEEETGEGDDDQSQEELPDDYTDVPFHQHPRFQQLVRERNDLRGPAGEYRKITDFMDANALTPEEAANGVSVMALAKMNPQEAFKQIAPWFKKVAIAAGEILSDDLAARVQKGELTREAALEIGRLTAGQQSAAARQAFEQQRGQREQQTQSTRALTDAASEWENDRQLKDPNFAAKLPRIQRELAWLHTTGQRPTTPEGVRKQLKTVYETVNRELGQQAAAKTRQQTRRPAVTPVRGGAVAGNARPESPSGTRSTVDIINDVIGKRA